MTEVAVVVPFRDRGRDPLRAANLVRVLEHWDNFDAPVHVVDDGRTGDAQFNRSVAYNRGAALAPSADVLIFTESDMLIDFAQIDEAIHQARKTPGLVVPFTERHEFEAEESAQIRLNDKQPNECHATIVMPKPRRTGAINVLTRETLDLVGQYDEAFEGSWWDDRSMHIAFDRCAGPTRWINGPSYHLYHLPGYVGDHLTDTDRAATAANRRRFHQYLLARTPQRIRDLTGGIR